MPELKLQSPLQYVKGVGPRRAQALAAHGLETVQDLLFYFPRHYLDRSTVAPISDLKIDQTVTILGEVKAHGILKGRKRRYEVILDDGTAAISLLFFAGLRYWERLFRKGQRFAATGTVTYFQGYQMVHPELERLDEDSDRLVHAGRIIPVYPQTAELNKAGLNSRGIRALTTYIFDNLSGQLPDVLPENTRIRFELPSLHQAIRQIHYPENQEQIERSRRRLAFDELLELQFIVVRNKGRKSSLKKSHRYAPPGRKMQAVRDSLPFRLTSSQQTVLEELFRDQRCERPMSRLLQGDVGCGKTVVAMLTAVYAAENELQTAFMVPTEILAEQHYRNWSQVLEGAGVRSALLTSSLKALAKKEIARQCAEGGIDILFGTHALIYDYVTFHRLGLVIIDEQHRFGVQQRGKLYAKGENPDLLVMTATPIPRTLALTLYGDLDIATISELPPGRQPIRTVWRTADARSRVYEWIREEVNRGGQVYCIYPLIEHSEQLELENVEEAYRLLVGGAFKDLRVGMVHGRTPTDERDRTLKLFREGEIDILMATTVVEVGIDNPNAIVMIIEHAERFGLAQLHQLRGRVGRGEKRSTVVAIAHPPLSDLARERLEAFVGLSDGFSIAEADLRLRGPGELFGVRQSGLPAMKAANLASDLDLLEAARKLLETMSHQQNQLDSEYRKLYSLLEERTKQQDIRLGGG